MRRLLILLTLLFTVFQAFAASLTPVDETGSFNSEQNLALFDFEDNEGAPDNVSVYLITQEPGDPLYTWFGHTALRVDIPDYLSWDYNWGVFSFSDSFYINFIMGRLLYSLSVYPSYFTASEAETENRTLTSLKLELDPQQTLGAVEFLNFNAREENRTYLYHYYLDNCATRVRDIYNAATGGAFRAWAESQQLQTTFRSLAEEQLDPRSRIASWTLNYLQGPQIDQPITLYDACFLPQVLSDSIALYQGTEAEVIYQSTRVQPEAKSDLATCSFLTGLVIAFIICIDRTKKQRFSNLTAFLFLLFLSIASSVLAFFMLFTDHEVTYLNENILFINPLLFIPCIESLLNLFRRKPRYKAGGCTLLLLTFIAAILLILKGFFPSVYIQQNQAAFALVLPVYIAIAVRWKTRKLEG